MLTLFADHIDVIAGVGNDDRCGHIIPCLLDGVKVKMDEHIPCLHAVAILDCCFKVLSIQIYGIQTDVDEQLNAILTLQPNGMPGREQCLYRAVKRRIDHAFIGESEIQFLNDLKKPYPSIRVSQFRDIFFEDVLNDPAKSDVIARYHLKPRSLSWFRSLFIQQGWKSPVSRKPLRRDGRAPHPLREPAPQRGMLIQIDGTPFEWIGNGEMWTLHLAVDDATTEPLAGCFMPTERQLGYCYVMYDTLTKYGIPMSLYSDKYTIFRSSKEGSLTQFG